jgi:ABC-type uncharacterized transport system substrate-binding protein
MYSGLNLLSPSISSLANFFSRALRFTSRISSWGLVLCVLCAIPAHADPLRITVLLSEQGGVYQTFSELLHVKLPVSEFALNTVSVDDKLVAADVYIAVGMKAAAALSTRNAPVLSVLVPKAGYEQLRHARAHHSAIFLDQPMERQVALLLDALPSIRRVGVLYSTPHPELPQLKRLLVERKVKLHEGAVDDAKDLNDTLETVLNESDALFVLPDPGVYNSRTIRNILLATYRKQIPLIGISQAYVRAGALFALYSTPDQIALQAASILRQYSVSHKLPSSQYPLRFEVSVNRQVARSLDIPVKAEDRLRDDIGKMR